MFDNTITELVLATTILILVTLMIKDVFFDKTCIKSFDVALVFVAVFFGLGPWIAFYYGKWAFPQNNIYAPSQTIDLLLKAYSVIYLYLLGIWIIKKLFIFIRKSHPTKLLPSEQTSIIQFLQQYDRIKWQHILLVVAFIWLLRIIVGLRYGIWYAGTASKENMSNLPYYIIIFRSLAKTISMGFLLWSSVCFWSKRQFFLKFTSASILIFELFWMFLNGRRNVLIWLIFLFFGFLASNHKSWLKYAVVFLVLVVIMLQFLFPLFASVRSFYYDSWRPELEEMNPVKRFNISIVSAFTKNNNTIKKHYRENMNSRPLYLRSFICQICKTLDNKSPMKGRALMRSVEYVIPSVIYPAKTSKLPTEQAIQKHFDCSLTDTASSWPALGCADFGISGGLIVGLIVGLWLVSLELWTQSIMTSYPLTSLTLVGAMITCLAHVESTPELNWILYRNILILLVIAKSLSFFKLFYLRGIKTICLSSKEK